MTYAEVESTGRSCSLLPGDITDPATCRSLVRQAVERLGKLDFLVSTAAYQNRKPPLRDVADEEFDWTFKTNVYAYYWLARAALEVMPDGGAIIATNSETGLRGSPGLPGYAATKRAINALTKTLAMNVIDRRIRANAVAPGPVRTPLNPSDDGLPSEQVAVLGKDKPMGRPAQPEEIAPAHVFLASNADSSKITGILLQVMGGETAGG